MVLKFWLGIDVLTVESGSHSVTDREHKQLGAFHPDVAFACEEAPFVARRFIESFFLKPFVPELPLTGAG